MKQGNGCRETRCYRLYIGNGNWVNLDADTTRDLLQIYENGTATRYPLAPGLYLDILPHDVDCNSKNTDLPRLMRADVCYDQHDETTTQQDLSKYIKTLLESQGIIDAFPPVKPSEPLPRITALPTHRHLSMVPTPLSVARRSNRARTKDEDIASVLFSSASSPSLSSASSSSISELPTKRKTRQTRRGRRDIKSEPKGANRKTDSNTDASAMVATAGLQWPSSKAESDASRHTVALSYAPSHMMTYTSSSLHGLKAVPSPTQRSGTMDAMAPNHDMYYAQQHPQEYSQSLLSHHPSDISGDLPLLPSGEKHYRTRPSVDVYSSLNTVGWIDRAMWPDEAFPGVPQQDMTGYAHVSNQLSYASEHPSYPASAVLALQTDPPRYDLSLMQLGATSPATPSATTCFHDTSQLQAALTETGSLFALTSQSSRQQQPASFRCAEYETEYSQPPKCQHDNDPTSSPASTSGALTSLGPRRSSSHSTASL